MKFGRAVAVVATLAPVIAGAQGAAYAAGISAARFGGEHGNVTTTNPTALYYNPAGMAFAETPTGWSIIGDTTVAFRQMTWQHALAPTDMPEPPGAEGATVGKATLSNRLPGGPYPGPMLGASLRRGDFAFGLGLMAPFAGEQTWDENLKFKNDATFPLAAGGGSALASDHRGTHLRLPDRRCRLSVEAARLRVDGKLHHLVAVQHAVQDAGRQRRAGCGP